LNSLVELEQEPVEAAAPEKAQAAKKRSFPTVIVAALSTMIVLLSIATGVIFYRNRKMNV